MNLTLKQNDRIIYFQFLRGGGHAETEIATNDTIASFQFVIKDQMWSWRLIPVRAVSALLVLRTCPLVQATDPLI